MKNPMQGTSGVALVLLSLGLWLRFCAVFGIPIHFDEPFWMIRGDYLIAELESGEISSLADSFWNIRESSDEDRTYSTNVGTGVPTALLTGLGRRLASPGPSPVEKMGVFRQIHSARFLNALVSALTPVSIFLLLRLVGLPILASCLAALYLLFDPIVTAHGSLAHMESTLTLTVPVSILLFEYSRRKRGWWIPVVGGAIFGVAFATRVNAAVVPVALLIYVVLRSFARTRRRPWADSRSIQDLERLLVFGLCGYGIFIVLYPPLWGSPILGFFEFLTQYGGRPGGGNLLAVIGSTFPPSWRMTAPVFLALALIGFGLKEVRRENLFQLGWILYLTGCLIIALGSRQFFDRYLGSVLPGLAIAGAVAAQYLLGTWTKARTWRFVGHLSALLLLGAMMAAALLGARDLQRAEQIRSFYRELPVPSVGRVVVVSADRVLGRTTAPYENRPSLFLSSRDWHVTLVYLGIGLSDLRGWEEFHSDWAEMEGVPAGQPGAGDLVVAMVGMGPPGSVKARLGNLEFRIVPDEEK